MIPFNDPPPLSPSLHAGRGISEKVYDFLLHGGHEEGTENTKIFLDLVNAYTIAVLS